MTVSDDLLVAYVDGELSSKDKERVETYLAQNPEAAARVSDWQQNDAALRHAFGVEPSPRHDPVVASNDNGPKFVWLRYAAAACLLVAVGFGAGLFSSSLQFGAKLPYQFQVAAWANEAHEIFAVDQNRPGEFEQKDFTLAQEWLKNRVGVDVGFPDLQKAELQFVGARLVGQGGEPAALLTYETSKAQRISVFIKGHREPLEDLGYWFFPTEDKTTCVWLSKNIAFTVTGALNNEQLKSIALDVRDTLSAGYTGLEI